MDDAFWRLLFSTILLVIMVLLRPSANSQRSGVNRKRRTHRSLQNVLQAILKPRLRTEGLFLPEAPVQSVLL